MNDQVFSNLISELQKDIAERIQRENIPALVIAVIDKDSILWEAGFGTTDRINRKPVTTQTIFSLLSCSKMFTATAVMLAVQDNLLNLDVPIRHYLPGFTIQSRYEHDPIDKITLRHLLSHKAGFTHEAPVGNNYIYDTGSSTFEAHIDSIQRTWLRYPVGQRYAYSNLGIDLAGFLLQKVSSLPFADYVKQKLFEPLGMDRSSFNFHEIKNAKDRAIGHDQYYDVLGLSVPLIIPMTPSGGIYTSVEDSTRFIQFHLNEGRARGQIILDPILIKEMYRIPWPTQDQKAGYGFGIAIDEHQGILRYSHGGGGFGFLSDIIWYPEVGLGIVLMTNSTSHRLQWWYANQILDKILELPEYKTRKNQVKNRKIPSETAPVSIEETKIPKDFVGNYMGREPNYCRIDLAKNGLSIRYSWDKKPKPLIFYSVDEAYVLISGKNKEDAGYHRYRFYRKNDGTPDYFINLHDGSAYDYNQGLNDQRDADMGYWRKFFGDYSVIGSYIPNIASIYKRNGHLYLNTGVSRVKLVEYQPGLFFTSTGEAIDFRGESPLIKGLIHKKISLGTKFNFAIILLRAFLRSRIARVKARYAIKK